MKPNKIQVLIKLTRLYLSIAITFSAIAGYLVCNHSFDIKVLYVALGVLFLSGSASAINQFQERKLDALMKRTQNRPLPANQIKPNTVIVISIILGVSGTLILLLGTTFNAALLGLFNLLWYNALYTPLKTKTTFAVIIGAVTGAVPPLMGWAAAGGNLLNPIILFTAFFMFLWQIPHFCLLLLKFKSDYKAAGFAAITSDIDDSYVKSIVFIWIFGTAVSSLFLPLFHIVSNNLLIIVLIIINAFIVIYFYKIIYSKKKLFSFKSAFRYINLYQVIILVILIIQALNK